MAEKHAVGIYLFSEFNNTVDIIKKCHEFHIFMIKFSALTFVFSDLHKYIHMYYIYVFTNHIIYDTSTYICMYIFAKVILSQIQTNRFPRL